MPLDRDRALLRAQAAMGRWLRLNVRRWSPAGVALARRVRCSPQRPEAGAISQPARSTRRAASEACSNFVEQGSGAEDLRCDEQHAGVGKAAEDGPPLLVVELGVDTMEEVKLRFERRIRQKVVCPNLHPLKILGEAGHGLGRVLRHNELPGGSEPVEPELESCSANSVGGHTHDAELVERTA